MKTTLRQAVTSLALTTLACGATSPGPGTPSGPGPSSDGSSLAACATDPLRSTGTTYFVCSCDSGADAACVSGNDSNAGTSPSAPKQTLSAAAALFRSLPAGGTVALCKGGRWNGQSTQSWSNTNCAAPSDAGGTSPGTWAGSTNTCELRSYPPPWGGSGARPYIATAGAFGSSFNTGSRVQGLEVHGSADGGNFVLYYDSRHDILYCDDVITNFAIGFQFECDATPGAQRFHVIGNAVYGNTMHGILGSPAGSWFVGNSIHDNGGNSILDHNMYLGCHAYQSAGIVVRGNTLWHSGNHDGSPCTSSSLMIHGWATGLLVEGNTIIEPATDSPSAQCWGIEIDTGGDSSHNGYDGTIIRGNIIKHVGNSGIAVSNNHGAIIENNLICDTQIELGERGDFGYGSTTYLNQGNTVRNNTVYVTSAGRLDAAQAGISFDSTANDLGGNAVYNNAIWVVGQMNGQCVHDAGGLLAFDDHNACATIANTTWFNEAGTDFTPKPGGPLSGTGYDASPYFAPATDITGASRPAQPSIGAYQ